MSSTEHSNIIQEGNPKYKNNLIVQLAIEFSLEVIPYVELLEEQRKYVIARQLLKSATSIGANVLEAQNAESRAEFIHKMKIALKEVDETDYWLILCNKAKSYPDTMNLPDRLSTIRKILNKIVSTSKNKTNLLANCHIGLSPNC